MKLTLPLLEIKGDNNLKDCKKASYSTIMTLGRNP